ncbi:hypothetical protein FGB62_47g165 [Gracilaria domingensis]|nr:hypothetical protein FGB62_47g165 [Gracilaria domingensis]
MNAVSTSPAAAGGRRRRRLVEAVGAVVVRVEVVRVVVGEVEEVVCVVVGGGVGVFVAGVVAVVERLMDGVHFLLNERSCSGDGALGALDVEKAVGGVGAVVVAVDVDVGVGARHHVADGFAALADDEAYCIAGDADG